MSDWYQEGSSKDDREKAASETPNWMPFEFFLREGETKRIIIVDDTDFCLWRHSVKLGEKKFVQLTCRAGMDGGAGCPLCAMGNNRRYYGFVTIIDTIGYKAANGEQKGKYMRYLFPMPNRDLERFIALRTKHTSLVGALIDVQRTSKDASRLGDMWDIVYADGKPVMGPQILEDKKLAYKSKKDGKLYPPEPFDYRKIFEPKTEGEIKAILSNTGGGSESGGFTGGGGYTPPESGGNGDVLY